MTIYITIDSPVVVLCFRLATAAALALAVMHVVK
jgi:hypothetical protein